MIVVSDTSPLNYLVLIDLQHILPELFERILIPAAVRDEFQSAGAPEAIARFMAAAPAWLETRQVSEVDPRLQHLDRGEREAITLAASLSAGSVLIDEKKGRLVARERGLAVSGTLGVLTRPGDADTAGIPLARSIFAARLGSPSCRCHPARVSAHMR